MSTYTLNLTLANIRTITVVFLDILVVWLLLYYVLRIVRSNTRTIQIFKGILMVVVIDGAAKLLGLKTLQFFADMFINWGFLAIIIIFQPEIRTLLEHIGKSSLFSRITTLTGNEKENLVDQIVTAVMLLSKDQTGALISIEQSRSLEDFISTGTRLNSDVTAELLTSIFVTSTPLHDGAVIIQGDKIACASAYFPPTNEELPSRYGARHRAAIGISEITDAVTIVVSEETGNVSITEGGKMMVVDREQLHNYLLRVICGESTEVHAKRAPKEVYVTAKKENAEKPEKRVSVLSKLAIRHQEEEEPVEKEKKSGKERKARKVAVEEVIPAKTSTAADHEPEETKEERVHREADQEAESVMIKLPHKKQRPVPSYPKQERKAAPEVKTQEEKPVKAAEPAPVIPEEPDDEIPDIVQEKPEVQAEAAAPAAEETVVMEPETPDLSASEEDASADEPAAPRTRYEEVRAAREAAYRIMYSQQAEQKKMKADSAKEAARKAARDGKYDTTQLDISRIVGFHDELDGAFDMVDDLPSQSSTRQKGGRK